MDEKSTREKILDVTYELVSEKGYDKASVGQICDLVGVKKPALYYYFQSKECLFLALIAQHCQEDPFRQFSQLLHVTHPSDYRQQFMTIGEAVVDNFQSNQKLRKFWAEIYLQSSRIPAVGALVDDNNRHFDTVCLSVLQHGDQIGVFRHGFNAPLTAQVTSVLVEGICNAIVWDNGIDNVPIWREFVRYLFASN